ncbi:hypothetical protein Tco_0992218 [Tanacetum coccineum]|uniref:Uncharacterized protein n=1 Tax=Tanacetum coccineum TaxID=301880 RepID=A0ABQ5F1X3_9ASTR
MNIELEHSVAKLRKENETLKKHYKDLYDSIKITRSKTIEQTTSLLANNADLKAQIQEKVFAIAALKNDIRKLKGNSVDTKFAKTSVLEKSIFTIHGFYPNKTSAVYEKTSPRSDLRWKPTGRIFKSIGLRWIPTRKLFDSCTSKDDSEPTHGSNIDIPNIHESKQTLDLSAELESLFDPLFDEYFNGVNQVVSKSFAVTIADAFDKRQQQPDSTSSTSTLAKTVFADGNFDFFNKYWYPTYTVERELSETEFMQYHGHNADYDCANTEQSQQSVSNDPYFGILIPEIPSDQSLSSKSIHTIVHPDHQISEHNSKWTKDHPLENIIGELARPVSTRLQLHKQALFFYYDAFLTSVEPKTYKDALTQSCWI